MIAEQFFRSNLAFSTNMFQRKQSRYYRWFPLILLFQAILAYVPSWLWNTLRDKRLHETVSNIKDPQKQHNRRKLLIINLANDLFTEMIQKRYAKPFFFCEFLNVIFFILNVVCTDMLFQNHFLMFGFAEIGMRFNKSAGSSLDYSEMFPTFARCSVPVITKATSYGGKREEAVCIISYNLLCESIFMFLWYIKFSNKNNFMHLKINLTFSLIFFFRMWFCLLAVATIVGVCYRILMILSQRKRKKLLMECVDKTFEGKIAEICEKLGFYSWFTLYRISRNVDPLTFQDLISSLMARLDCVPLYKTIKVNTTTTSTRHTGEHDTQDLATVV